MKPLTRDDLLEPEAYEAVRGDLRRALLAHKRDRRLAVGDVVTLLFEDRETLRFQVLEMLRVERIRDPEAIQHELDVYNELMPGNDELSATLMIEITESERIRSELDRLIGLDEHVSLRIGEGDAADVVPARFDEKQLEEDRISAVQYIRFPLTPAQRERFCTPDEPVRVLIDHANYAHEAAIAGAVRESLIRDLRGEAPSLLPRGAAGTRPATAPLYEDARARAVALGGAEAAAIVVESKLPVASIVEAERAHLLELLELVRHYAAQLSERHGSCIVTTQTGAGSERLRFLLRGGRG